MKSRQQENNETREDRKYCQSHLGAGKGGMATKGGLTNAWSMVGPKRKTKKKRQS